MKERLLDVIKWGLILIIAGAVFYVVYPKYGFEKFNSYSLFRYNKITGQMDHLAGANKGWIRVDKPLKEDDVSGQAEKQLKEEGRFINKNDKPETKP